MRRFVIAIVLLLAAASGFAQSRSELQAQAAQLREQIASIKATADYMMAHRLRLLEQLPALEAEVAAVEAKIAALGSDDVLRYWYTSDDGDGPSRSHWSRHLKISWVHYNGDFTDADGTPQGAVPFIQVPVSATGPLPIYIAKPQAFRKGILLRNSGKSSPYVTIAGRLSATPPTLTVFLDDGTERTLPVLSLAKWDTTTYSGADTRQSARLSANTASVLALFDIPANARSARLDLTITARAYASNVAVFALNPPGIMYPHEHAPVPGLAAEVADEDALKTHPDVLRAGDFDLRKTRAEGGTFDSPNQAAHVTKEYLPDPLAPGRIIYRSMFKQRDGSAKGDANWRGSLSAGMSFVPADTTDPMFPLKEQAPKELFARKCFLLESDWLARNDANKMSLGWSLRYGYWTKAVGGYWQETTGNGGAKGTGKKVIKVNRDGSTQWEYQGHSIRLEAGKAPKDPAHPHDALRPLESYVYHLDQPGGYGSGMRWGNAVVERGRWHCIEQQIKVNSIVGPFDANGNGEAVADGLLRTWVDGVFVGERTALRWHRHPDMGIEGPWVNWFFGGKQAADHQMHYQNADIVVARRYIGLPRNFGQRNN